MKRDILYVDDEADNLVVFEATFDEYFNVVTAGSGQEALDLLETRAFPVVVADQRMPRMTGAELFEAMRRKHPHTKRVMLTGYADSQAMLDAINQGQVFYFIKKPWEQDVVYSTLVRAIEAYDMWLSNVALHRPAGRLRPLRHARPFGRAVAHEMGNQLCMLPLVELIEDEYSGHEDLMRMAGLARSTHERLLQIMNEVKSFVRFEREEVVTQQLDLAEALHELVEFLRYERSLPLDRLHVAIKAEPRAKANRVKLQQVVLNLLKNAAHAIGTLPQGRIELTLDVEADQAVITVSDNGCGMTAEVAQKIWEPFFTTKGDEGTGLGLDVARSIVEAHGGTIDCVTAPNQGARFTIRLPRHEPAPAIERPAVAPGAALAATAGALQPLTPAITQPI